jgi:hypothetical protein
MMHRVIESAGNNTKDKTKGSFHEGGWRTLSESKRFRVPYPCAMIVGAGWGSSPVPGAESFPTICRRPETNSPRPSFQ